MFPSRGIALVLALYTFPQGTPEHYGFLGQRKSGMSSSWDLKGNWGPSLVSPWTMSVSSTRPRIPSLLLFHYRACSSIKAHDEKMTDFEKSPSIIPLNSVLVFTSLHLTLPHFTSPHFIIFFFTFKHPNPHSLFLDHPHHGACFLI